MNTVNNKRGVIYWLPRILSLGFVLFLSLFALDVFNEYNGWELLLALFMHLIPTFVLLIFLVIAWRYALVGATVFLGFAIFYVVMAGLDRPWTWYAFISGPSALVGILFFVSWYLKCKNKNN